MKALIVLFATQMIPSIVEWMSKKYFKVSARARRRKHEYEKKV